MNPITRLLFFLYCTIIFDIASSCTEKQSIAPSSETQDVELDSFADTVLPPSFIDTIKKYAFVRGKYVQFSWRSGEKLNRMRPDFFNQYLSGFTTTYPDKWLLEPNSFANYFFYDFQEFKTWILFSILVDNESGFTELYQYTYSKSTGEITTVSRIGVEEVDGGAVRKDVLTYSQSGQKLTVRSQSYYDEDIFEDNSYSDCYSRSFDSIVSHFHFYPDRTEFSVDTVFSKLDTICRQ